MTVLSGAGHLRQRESIGMTNSGGRPPVYYHDYLQLDRLLGSQTPESVRYGEEAHDELLFIIVHQAYELWFKQILHELEDVHEVFSRPRVPEREMGKVVSRLERVVAIQRILLDHVDALETMTPLDFLDFRNLLVPASGFQSLQFRLIENLLGLPHSERVLINEADYTTRFSREHREILEQSHVRPTLFDLVDAWLQRTPFLHFGDFEFWDAYRGAVERMLDRDRDLITSNPNLTDEGRDEQLARFEATADTFSALFDPGEYEALAAAGARRLSREAFLAALLINLYRDEPILQLPFRVLRALMDVDEGFTTWRYRHAIMVQRMIGSKIGTGGTSGHDYLRETARRHRVWSDLFDLSTFFIPRSELPELPASVTEAMRFHLTPGPQ
jgi:tryptophan 2,3-dioxygenase